MAHPAQGLSVAPRPLHADTLAASAIAKGDRKLPAVFIFA
jgi:hypothetical protein